MSDLWIFKSRVTARVRKKLSMSIFFLRYQLCVSWQQVLTIAFSCNLNVHIIISHWCITVCSVRSIKEQSHVTEYNTVIKHDTLCSVSSVLSCNLCRYLSRCPYLSWDMYTKAWGDVLINSSQDESLNDATQTPDCVDSFRMTRKPTPSYLCTCRKRDT